MSKGWSFWGGSPVYDINLKLISLKLACQQNSHKWACSQASLKLAVKNHKKAPTNPRRLINTLKKVQTWDKRKWDWPDCDCN